jgi:protein-disulfide isomerase
VLNRCNIALLLLWPVAVVAQSRTACSSLPESSKNRIMSYVQQKYRVQAGAVRVESMTSIAGCYYKLRVAWDVNKIPFVKTLFLAPDRIHLSTELFDVMVDPGEEEHLRDMETARELAYGSPASIGRENAPVTVVVFSDFQCPYCSDAANALEEELRRPAANVRVVFRNFPLSTHPWARKAAEAAACVAAQRSDSFWKIHDFLFEKQRILTVTTIDEDLEEYVDTLPGINAGAFRQCVLNAETRAIIDHDVALGREYDVKATPTLFLNGHKIPPISGQADLHEAVVHALGNSSKH